MRKSFLLKEIYKNFLPEQEITEQQILLLELDDVRNIRYRDPLYLGEYVRAYSRGMARCYVFLDEIQMVYTIVNPNLTEGRHILARKGDTQVVTFVDVMLGLAREKNIDLYVTGSNSKMLSSDIITEFRDKAVNIHLAPLSFDEYFEYKGGNETEALYKYMQFGGMPQAVLKNERDKKDYLKELFETTYFRDIIERNQLRKSSSLDELCNIISTATGELLNAKKIADTFRSVKHERIDPQTVEKYIRYFEALLASLWVKITESPVFMQGCVPSTFCLEVEP